MPSTDTISDSFHPWKTVKTFFNCGKKTDSIKFTVLNILNVCFSSFKYIHVVQPISATFHLAKLKFFTY